MTLTEADTKNRPKGQPCRFNPKHRTRLATWYAGASWGGTGMWFCDECKEACEKSTIGRTGLIHFQKVEELQEGGLR